MRENKGVVGVEEKPSEGYCPLSSPLAMKTRTSGSLQSRLCLCVCVHVCVRTVDVWVVYVRSHLSPIFKLRLIRLFKAITLCLGGGE